MQKRKQPNYNAKCLQCAAGIRRDTKSGLCRACASVCHCGTAKDYRAAECQSCGMRRKTTLQWQRPESRAVILAGCQRAGRERRRLFADISEDSIWECRPSDGRYFIRYWEGDKERTIYRYQWRWIQVNGPIPKGYVIHHKDEVNTHDDVGNLELLTNSAHVSLHQRERTGAIPLIPCPTCQKPFRRYKRKRWHTPYRQYCSRRCWNLHQQGVALAVTSGDVSFIERAYLAEQIA